ncbi:hypothetical protein Tco_0995657 [Tanacetum coccineum]
MGEGSKAKGHPEFLFGDNNLFSFFRRGRRNRKTNDHQNLNRRALRTPDIRGRGCVLRSSIRTLLRQAPSRSKKPDGPSYHITHRIQWRNHLANRPDFPTSKDRQNGHKKDPCRTIHGTRNVKIPGKRRNGNDTKQQSHPDGMCNDLRT